jgi:predicted deacylase
MIFALIIVILWIIACFTEKFGKKIHDRRIDTNNIQPIQSIQHYDFGTKSGFNICFLASVHGNEPAGCAILELMVRNGYLSRYMSGRHGMIRVIPRGNPWGLAHNNRYDISGNDINRNFLDRPKDANAEYLLKLMDGFDLVVDIHEGWGFYREGKGSIGSTISPSRDQLASQIALVMSTNVNKGISDPIKKFAVLPKQSCEITTALACHMEKKNRSYILIETTGQNDVQPLRLRMSQNLVCILTALDLVYCV